MKILQSVQIYIVIFQTDDEGKRKRLLSASDFDEVS